MNSMDASRFITWKGEYVGGFSNFIYANPQGPIMPLGYLRNFYICLAAAIYMKH